MGERDDYADGSRADHEPTLARNATGKPYPEAAVRFGPTGQVDRFEYR
jgi:hypothetical protein